MSSPLDNLGPRVIVTKFKPDVTSEYSREYRALCHEGSELRLPELPPDCPKCHSPTGKLILQLCYKEGVTAKWSLICSNPGAAPKCGFRQIPPQPAPPRELLDRIAALRVCEDADKAEAQQLAEDVQHASALSQVERAAAENARRAEKVFFTAVRANQNTNKVLARKRKQDEELLAATNAMRAKFTADDVLSSKVAKPKKTSDVPARPRPSVLIFWDKDGKPPQRVPIQIPADNKFNVGSYLAARGVGLLTWDRWDIEGAIWTLGHQNFVEVPENDHAILVRASSVRRCIQFAEEVQLLEDIRGTTKTARAAELNAATERFDTIMTRTQTDIAHVWVVLYWKDAVGPHVWQLARGERVAEADTVKLSDHAEVFTLWERTTRERAIHVWSVQRTDWIEYDIFEPIRIPRFATTIVLRLPEVDNLPYLGVEIFALANPHAQVLGSKTRKRAAPAIDEQQAPPTKKVKRAVASSKGPSRRPRARRAMNAQAGSSTNGDLSAALTGMPQGFFGMNDVL